MTFGDRRLNHLQCNCWGMIVVEIDGAVDVGRREGFAVG